jgi:hypothetical protein
LHVVRTETHLPGCVIEAWMSVPETHLRYRGMHLNLQKLNGVEDTKRRELRFEKGPA